MDNYPNLEFSDNDAAERGEETLDTMELPNAPSSDELDKLDGIDIAFKSPTKRRPSSPLSTRNGSNGNDSNGSTPSGGAREVEGPRARADEMSSSSPTIPRIPSLYQDTLGTYTELLNWFDTCSPRGEFLLSLPQDEEFSVDEFLSYDESDQDTKRIKLRRLLYYLLGSYESVESLADHKSRIEERVARFTTDHNITEHIHLPSEDFLELTVLFVCLAMSPKVAVEPAFIAQLAKQIADMRWKVSDDQSHSQSGNGDTNDLLPPSNSPQLLCQLIMVFRVALIRGLGGSKELEETQERRWEALRHLENEGCNKNSETTDSSTVQAVYPLEYASFLNAISARFPVSHLPESREPPEYLELGRSVFGIHGDGSPLFPSSTSTTTKNSGRMGGAPADIANTDTFIPYVPASIEEACNLYKSRVLITPELQQYWAEQEMLLASKSTANGIREPPPLPKVDELYCQMLPFAKSFVRVIVDFIIRRVQGTPNGGLHSAVTLLRVLLDWFKASHVLKKDFYAALLFDAQFYLVAHRYCATHSAALETLLMADSPGGFWELTKEVSVRGRSVSIAAYGLPLPRGLKVFNPSPTRQVVVEDFSQMNLEIYVNLIAVSRTIVQGQPQRLIVTSELSPNPLKSLLHVYNKELWDQVLELFKAQVPYNGKRWRFLNMEIISAIYLHCESRLDDDWLTGVDVAAEAKLARDKESMLRKLTEVYNERIRQVRPKNPITHVL